MRVLVPLAEGFEEIEAVTIVDVLRRAGAEVVVAGLVPGACRGSRGVVVEPDAALDAVKDSRFDAIAIPGGAKGAEALRNDERVLELVRRQHARGQLVAAICAGPTVLEKAGVLRGRAATSHPSVQAELTQKGVAIRAAERVCEDGNVLTSQAPGTALEFAYAIVARLAGKAKVAELDAGILSPSVQR